jgi:hypothetical protein
VPPLAPSPVGSDARSHRHHKRAFLAGMDVFEPAQHHHQHILHGVLHVGVADAEPPRCPIDRVEVLVHDVHQSRGGVPCAAAHVGRTRERQPEQAPVHGE